MASIKELLGEDYRDDMTVAEIEAALASKKFADLSTGQYVALGKYNAAVAARDDAIAKYNGTLTEQQRQEQEAAAQAERYKAIERENLIYRYTKQLSASITDATVLDNVATLMADGKFEEAITAQNEFHAKNRESIEQSVREQFMKTNPQPNPQGGSTTVTKEEFDKMGYAEKARLYKEDRATYDSLNK